MQLIKKVSADLILEIANKVVSRYVSRQVIPVREKDDVAMALVERYLQKEEKITEAFEGRSKVTTYLVAVLNRMCCEIIRRESKHWYSVADDADDTNQERSTWEPAEAEKTVILKNEAKRLANTMLFFNGDRVKTNLFLKYYFKIPVSKEDVDLYSKGEIEGLKELLNAEESISKGEIFENLAQIVNVVEGKQVKGDAVRMWVNKQLDTILTRMNRNGNSHHTKESIQLLFELQEQ